MTINDAAIIEIFGPESSGLSYMERARSSKRRFVRSQDQLALIEEDENPPGHHLTAFEALEAFGIEVVLETIREGVAVLICSPQEPAATIQKRREALGLSIEAVAEHAGLDPSFIKKAEDPSCRSSIWDLQKICQILSLDDAVIGSIEGAYGHKALAARLKSFNKHSCLLDEKLIIQLSEAAWVMRTELKLQTWLEHDVHAREPFNPEYLNDSISAWQQGCDLAQIARERLGLDPDERIDSIVDLCLFDLEIPMISLELPNYIAGATIAAGRGIVINKNGDNSNALARRMTIAHELGHYLWDPIKYLNGLRLDHYSMLNQQMISDLVEQRANAFAAAFLAPVNAVQKIFSSQPTAEEGLKKTIHYFGIDFQTAKNIISSFFGSEALDKIDDIDINSTQNWWEKVEVSPEYYGIFSRLVADAENTNLITVHTAAAYLGCTIEEYQTSKQQLLVVNNW